MAGETRNDSIPSLRCVADPDDCYLGSYFYEAELKANLKVGVMPSGSLWLNDHDRKVYEVYGMEGEEQQLLAVSPVRLKRMEMRFPRLNRALTSAGVC